MRFPPHSPAPCSPTPRRVSFVKTASYAVPGFFVTGLMQLLCELSSSSLTTEWMKTGKRTIHTCGGVGPLGARARGRSPRARAAREDLRERLPVELEGLLRDLALAVPLLDPVVLLHVRQAAHPSFRRRGQGRRPRRRGAGQGQGPAQEHGAGEGVRRGRGRERCGPSVRARRELKNKPPPRAREADFGLVPPLAVKTMASHRSR